MTSPRLTPRETCMRRSSVTLLLVTVDHPSLHLDSTTHRIDDARKLRQQTVASIFDDAAPVLPDLRINQFAGDAS